MVAVNRIPGARLRRNNVGVLEDRRGVKIRYGLGIGSADLVGVCRMTVGRFVDGDRAVVTSIGRAFAMEVKRPGEHPTEDQLRWMSEVRKLGGFAAVVHSVEEALQAVERCRVGESA